MFRKLQEPIANVVTIYVDGEPVQAELGETAAGVLVRLTPLLSRKTPVKQSARAPYCMMGVCFDCLAIVDGVPSIQTCQTSVREGMVIQRQYGRHGV